jgi:hypothetical protein
MWNHPDYGPAYGESDYQADKATCDKANAYWQANATHGRHGSSMSAELAAHPDYAACNNETRSRVEMWELRRDKPAKIFAYYRDCNAGTKLHRGGRLEITNFMGARLGYATVQTVWRSNFGDTRASFRASLFDGCEYSGTLYGDSGTYCRLRSIKGK